MCPPGGKRAYYSTVGFYPAMGIFKKNYFFLIILHFGAGGGYYDIIRGMKIEHSILVLAAALVVSAVIIASAWRYSIDNHPDRYKFIETGTLYTVLDTASGRWYKALIDDKVPTLRK